METADALQLDHQLDSPARRVSLTIDELLDRYGRLVECAARRIIGPRGDIDDIVQETWLTYLRSGHQVHAEATLGGWLFQVASRIALRVRTRSTRVDAAGTLADRADRADDGPDSDTKLMRAQQRIALDSACAVLTDHERQLLDLFRNEADYGYREISRRLGIPIGSVGPTRERLIRKLRACPDLQRLAAA